MICKYTDDQMYIYITYIYIHNVMLYLISMYRHYDRPGTKNGSAWDQKRFMFVVVL